MTIATLIKINQNKKLMMKISEKAYDIIHYRLMEESRKQNFPVERLATFTLTNDKDEENGNSHGCCNFVMVSLDKYDKLNMLKFEKLLRKEVSFQYRLKPYDFIADDARRCGINVELVSIRQVPKRIDFDEEEGEHESLPDPPVLQRQNAYVAQASMLAPGHVSVPTQVARELVRRRRRADYIPHISSESELSGVLAEVQKLEDLIAANEQAIGATD